MQSTATWALRPCLVIYNLALVSRTLTNKRFVTIIEAEGDNAYASAGPDFSDLVTDDTLHLQSNAKLQTAGQRFAVKILAAL